MTTDINNASLNVLQILEKWQLNDEEQLLLLNLSTTIKQRHLYLYRRGDRILNFNDDLINRLEIIIGIYNSLCTTYPTSQDYATIWLRRAQKKFKGKTPLEIMLKNKTGMNRVWSFLDCTQSWRK